MSSNEIICLREIDWSAIDSLQSRPTRDSFDQLIKNLQCNDSTISVATRIWNFKHNQKQNISNNNFSDTEFACEDSNYSSPVPNPGFPVVDASIISSPPPRRLRDLYIHEELGRGAFGVVYRVTETIDATTSLALKQIPLASHSHASVIADEVAILSGLDHPNIVKYFRSFVSGGCLYILMELISGVRLSQHIAAFTARGDLMTEDAIWAIVTQICLALSYLHIDKHIIHRDLTLNNVMIDQKSRIKLTDMGLARNNHSNGNINFNGDSGDTSSNSNGDMPVGTLSYASPEVIQRKPYSEKADLWSLGCILYALATGKAAFPGDNPLTLAQKIVHGSFQPLQLGFSPLLYEMVRRLLTVNPNHRPDIIQTSSLMGPVLMAELDRQQSASLLLERQLDEAAEIKKIFSAELQRIKKIGRKKMEKNRQQKKQNFPAKIQSEEIFNQQRAEENGEEEKDSEFSDSLSILNKLSFAAKYGGENCSDALTEFIDKSLENREEILKLTEETRESITRHRASTIKSSGNSSPNWPRSSADSPILSSLESSKNNSPRINQPDGNYYSAISEALEFALNESGYYQNTKAKKMTRPNSSRVLFGG